MSQRTNWNCGFGWNRIACQIRFFGNFILKGTWFAKSVACARKVLLPENFKNSLSLCFGNLPLIAGLWWAGQVTSTGLPVKRLRLTLIPTMLLIISVPAWSAILNCLDRKSV